MKEVFKMNARKVFSIIVIITFAFTFIIPTRDSFASIETVLPAPGTMLNLSPVYVPVLLKGLKIDQNNPFNFSFIVDTGNTKLNINDVNFKNESNRLIKYFLASLTIPENDLWVNLSPYEKDRMIANNLGQTEMGHEMLAQDYILKQLTASLIYPERSLGKSFWNKVYQKALELYNTTDIPLNTFNKVWILADSADVVESDNAGFIIGAHLKVMLDEDYLAAKKHSTPLLSPTENRVRSIQSNIIREIILPEIENEVNHGKNFAPLRQIYYSMILASWFKLAFKDAVINKIYSNQSKVRIGINTNDASEKERIYERYLRAYKKGVFNYIKEDISAASNETIPRKYFSGGELGGIREKDLHRHKNEIPKGANIADGDLAVLSIEAKPAAALPSDSDYPYRVIVPDEAKVKSRPNNQLAQEADGIRRTGLIVYSPVELKGVKNQKWGPVRPDGVPQSVATVEGGGVFGLSLANHMATAGLTVGLNEKGYFGQSFSDLYQPQPGLRTFFDRIIGAQPGYSPDDLVAEFYSELPRYRRNAIKARNVINDATGRKFVGIAPEASRLDKIYRNTPVTRAEFFQHLLDEAYALKRSKNAVATEEDGIVNREFDPKAGLWRITDEHGGFQYSEYHIDTTGMLGEGQFEKVPDITRNFAEANSGNYTKIFQVSDAEEMPKAVSLLSKTPLITSSNLNQPAYVEYLRLLPPGSRVVFAGGGLALANAIIHALNINPKLVIISFSEKELDIHPSQMNVQNRIPSLIDSLQGNPALRENISKDHQKHGTPVTALVGNPIKEKSKPWPKASQSFEEGFIYQVLGKKFDSLGFELRPVEKFGRHYIEVFDKREGGSTFLVELEGGLVSAIGWDEKALSQSILKKYGPENIELDENGIVKLSPDGFTSAKNPRLILAGIVAAAAFRAPITTSAHFAPILSRWIVDHILGIKAPRLSDDELARKISRDYKFLAKYVKKSSNAKDLLILSQQRPGFNSLKVRELFFEATRFITQQVGGSEKDQEWLEERASRMVWDSVQPGFDFARIKSEYQENPASADFNPREIIKRIKQIDLLGITEGNLDQIGQPYRDPNTIVGLYNSIQEITQNPAATEQLLHAATQKGVGLERALSIYHVFLSYGYPVVVSATLTRAAIAYFPQTTVNATLEKVKRTRQANYQIFNSFITNLNESNNTTDDYFRRLTRLSKFFNLVKPKDYLLAERIYTLLAYYTQDNEVANFFDNLGSLSKLNQIEIIYYNKKAAQEDLRPRLEQRYQSLFNHMPIGLQEQYRQADDFLRQVLELPDRAAFGIVPDPNGGIELNGLNLHFNIERRQSGSVIKFNQQLIDQIRIAGYDGINFKIDSVFYLTTTELPEILGLK